MTSGYLVAILTLIVSVAMKTIGIKGFDPLSCYMSLKAGGLNVGYRNSSGNG